MHFTGKVMRLRFKAEPAFLRPDFVKDIPKISFAVQRKIL